MWHEFENYVKVEIWVLHSQFTNSHFHLHITVEMKTLNGASVSQNLFLHLCCVHTHPWCAELNSTQSNMLHSQYTITTHLYQLSVYLNGGNKVCPQEPNHTSYIITPHQLIPLTANDSRTTCRMLLLQVLPTIEIQMLDSQVTSQWISSSCVTYCCVYSKYFQLMHTVW